MKLDKMIFGMLKAAAPAPIKALMDEASTGSEKFNHHSLDGVRQALEASNLNAQNIPHMLKAFGDSRIAPFVNMIPGVRDSVNHAANAIMNENKQTTTSTPNAGNVNFSNSSGSVDSLKARLDKLS